MSAVRHGYLKTTGLASLGALGSCKTWHNQVPREPSRFYDWRARRYAMQRSSAVQTLADAARMHAGARIRGFEKLTGHVRGSGGAAMCGTRDANRLPWQEGTPTRRRGWVRDAGQPSTLRLMGQLENEWFSMGAAACISRVSCRELDVQSWVVCLERKRRSWRMNACLHVPDSSPRIVRGGQTSQINVHIAFQMTARYVHRTARQDPSPDWRVE
jgi:hypothetical protein